MSGENLLRAIVVTLFLIYLLVMFSSCGRQHWQKRGEKKGWIETKIDTIVTDSVQYDTIFKYREVKDTVTLHKDKLTVKYFYNTKDSTVFLWGKCDGDTVYVQKQTIKMIEGNFLKTNWFPILCVLIIIFLIWFSKR